MEDWVSSRGGGGGRVSRVGGYLRNWVSSGSGFRVSGDWISQRDRVLGTGHLGCRVFSEIGYYGGKVSGDRVYGGRISGGRVSVE